MWDWSITNLQSVLAIMIDTNEVANELNPTDSTNSSKPVMLISRNRTSISQR